MIDLILAAIGLAFVGALAVIEAVCVLTGQATISRRIQEWARRNVQIAVFLGVVAGWLIAHFSGIPG